MTIKTETEKRKDGTWIAIDADGYGKTNVLMGTGKTSLDARKDLLCKMTILKIIEDK